MPLDVDAVTSPRYTREPLTLSLHLIEVSHISIRKSSITLRCFNFSMQCRRLQCTANIQINNKFKESFILFVENKAFPDLILC